MKTFVKIKEQRIILIKSTHFKGQKNNFSGLAAMRESK